MSTSPSTTEAPQTVRPRGGNPYPGPQPFTRDQRDYFFGRDAEARELATLLVAERVVLLYSPSGAGKTSLIQARLLDALEQKRFEVLPVVRVGQPPEAAGTPRSTNR